jgi:predicted enzyme related to lactoylglutathione lyase
MNYETISADEFGRSLSGVGVNILVKDVRRTVRFLEGVFALKCHQ